MGFVGSVGMGDVCWILPALVWRGSEEGVFLLDRQWRCGRDAFFFCSSFDHLCFVLFCFSLTNALFGERAWRFELGR